MKKKQSSINYKCLGDKCPNNCCGTFKGMTNSLIQVNEISHTEIVLLPNDIKYLKNISRDDLIVKKGKYSLIKTHNDGTCFALKNNRCTIYENRPSICRAYPFYFDLFTGLCLHKSCSGICQGRTNPSQLVHYYENVIEVYKYWINEIR